MSTFLKICQDVARECGVAGGADVTPKPTTVNSQRGELSRVINYVITAYTEIQGARNWRWLRRSFEFDTVIGQSTYNFSECTDVKDAAPITRFKTWRLQDRVNAPKLFLKSAGVGAQIFLSYSSWDNFEHLYRTGSLNLQEALPVHITVDPADDIALGLTPDNIYTVRGDYHKSAQILEFDTDVPEMPEAYHNLIMYQAMEYYGMYESAPEVLARSSKGMRRLMNQLKRNQGAAFGFGGPLA